MYISPWFDPQLCKEKRTCFTSLGTAGLWVQQLRMVQYTRPLCRQDAGKENLSTANQKLTHKEH